METYLIQGVLGCLPFFALYMTIFFLALANLDKLYQAALWSETLQYSGPSYTKLLYIHTRP